MLVIMDSAPEQTASGLDAANPVEYITEGSAAFCHVTSDADRTWTKIQLHQWVKERNVDRKRCKVSVYRVDTLVTQAC